MQLRPNTVFVLHLLVVGSTLAASSQRASTTLRKKIFGGTAAPGEADSGTLPVSPLSTSNNTTSTTETSSVRPQDVSLNTCELREYHNIKGVAAGHVGREGVVGSSNTTLLGYGRVFTAVASVQNVGTDAASDVTLRFYASEDAHLDPTDKLLRVATNTQHLVPGYAMWYQYVGRADWHGSRYILALWASACGDVGSRVDQIVGIVTVYQHDGSPYTPSPTPHPSADDAYTPNPTAYPANQYTRSPTPYPQNQDTHHPTAYPTEPEHQTYSPTKYPTEHPIEPTAYPTEVEPTYQPTRRPTSGCGYSGC